MRVEAAGVVGELEPAGDWSAVLHVDTGAPGLERWVEHAAGEAAALGALDLRAPHPFPGSTRVAVGEHAAPVPLELADAASTRALGARLATALRPGDLVVLTGPLGAGKTTLTSGLGEALGVRGRVTSPTFVLARRHHGPVPLLHADAYRLRESGAAGADDLLDLGLDEALEDAVSVVEWGEGLVEAVAEDRLHVVLSRPRDGSGRRAEVRATGARWAVLPR